MTEPARDARGRIINPQYTSEELGLRLMRLFDSAYHADELTPERVFEMTGVRMERPPQSSVVTARAIGYMTNGWYYLLELSNQPSTGNKFSFNINNPEDRNVLLTHRYAPRTPVCGFDLEQYKAHLEQMGFTGSLYRGGLSNTYWHFYRGELVVQVYFVGESSEHADHKCVDMVIAVSAVESWLDRMERDVK